MTCRGRTTRVAGALLGAAIAGGCASLTVMSHVPLSTVSRLALLRPHRGLGSAEHRLPTRSRLTRATVSMSTERFSLVPNPDIGRHWRRN